jgi:hypothetical protein
MPDPGICLSYRFAARQAAGREHMRRLIRHQSSAQAVSETNAPFASELDQWHLILSCNPACDLAGLLYARLDAGRLLPDPACQLDRPLTMVRDDPHVNISA